MEKFNVEYADDCIHLKACRRICKFHKINNRGCQKDYCTAYETIEDFTSENDLYTRTQVQKVKDGACYDGRNGLDEGDCLIEDYI